MIKNFRSKALRRFSEKGDRSKLPADMADKVARALTALNAAAHPSDMAAAGFKYHPLTSQGLGRHSLTITANWRLTFGWENGHATDVDLEDYH